MTGAGEVDPFVQDAPEVSNRWLADPALRRALRRALPAGLFATAAAEAETLAGRAAGELARLGRRAEANPPQHVAYDAWGNRIDALDVDEAWPALVAAGAEAGLVAVAYEDTYGPYARVVQAALIQLFSATTATASCPLAMTDAAATVLRLHDPALAEGVVPRLLARTDGWTSGQWMTEKEGGSDLGRSGTTARQRDDGVWQLTGTKWFTSATTAEVALALARPEGAESGTRGLSVFLVHLRRPDGTWNGLRVRRLKHKLGTKALPTAEMDLVDTVAEPIGGLGRGIPKVAAMLNVARLWSTHGAVSATGQALALARDYARRREVLGTSLDEQPAHRAWIADLAATYEAMVALSFRAAEVHGQHEGGIGNPALARILPPLAKLACARQAVDVTSNLLESFGGAGYLEDTGIPQLLRDVHVQCIWEGTTTVLALDVVRALRDPDVGTALLADMETQLGDESGVAADRVRAVVPELRVLLKDGTDARRLAWGLARAYQAALLCATATWARHTDGDTAPATAALLFTNRPLLDPAYEASDDDLTALAFPA
jgi:alkylation response protein AidB-like acyl-CoA dehydrogenase